VTKTISKFTVLVAAKVAIVAKIGPAQGLHTSPKDKPVINPPQKPLEELLMPKLPLILLTNPSKILERVGITSVNPKKPITITAKRRSVLGSKLKSFTKYEIVKVKRAKLIIIPKVMPNGFLFSPVTDDEKIIGKRGQIHGARIVIKPDKKAKNKRIVMQIF